MLRSLPQSRHHQRGVGFAAVLVILVLMAVVAGVWQSMSRDSSSSTATKVVQMQATAAISQAGDLRSAMNRFLLDNNTETGMLFTTASGGLFDPTKGYGTLQSIPGQITSSGSPGTWIFHSLNVKINGVGAAGNSTVAVATPDVSLAACQAINNQIYNASLSATPPTSSAAYTAWSTAATAVDDSATSAMAGYATGCVKTSDGKYVLYAALTEH